MDTLWLIIAAVVTILIVCVVTRIIVEQMRKKKDLKGDNQHPPESNSNSSSERKELERQLKEALNSNKEAVSLKAKLDTQISDLKTKLKQKETELCNLQAKVNELSEIPSDAKEGILINSLKKDLKKKSDEVETKEEEIENLEDEISSIKKKLKSAKSEIEELTYKIETFEKKSKQLERDLQDVNSELSDLKAEDEVKSEAIGFVNAVLQAKDANDRDAKIVNEKVSKIESIIIDQFIPLQRQYFTDIENIDDRINQVYAIISHWANLQRKSWLKRKKVVAFIGEFSAGKTSIVNRILSQDDPDCPKLPVSSKATTAIATYISYGEGFNSQFIDANGNLKNLPSEMFVKVSKDILAKVNVSSIIQYFVMKYKNENLRGLSILDTPGFSSNDDQDKDRTLAVINEADALFWVLDANSGEVNRTSLKIIADHVQDIPLYVVINKADTKAPAELDKLESHIRATMTRAEVNVSGYVRFSQKAPLEDIMKVIESLPEGRTGLDIGHICCNLKRDLVSLQNSLDEYKKEIRELKKVLENREEVLKEDIDNVIDACKSIASIPQYNSRWLSKDDYRMDQEEYQKLTDLCEGSEEASDQVKECFDDYKEFISEYHQVSNTQNEIKEQFTATKNVHTLLMNAIKSLDAQLYQEIEETVKETLDAEVREERTSNRETSANNRYSGSSANSDANNSSTTSQQELEKADRFHKQGAIEEAKFWYRLSAQHGNEQAKKMCHQLGVKF